MNSPLAEIFLSIIMGIILPGIIISTLLNYAPGAEAKEFEEADDLFTIKLQTDSGTVQTMPMEEYLIHVVAAELPPDFETEAMKAQAVAARTYAAKVYLSGSKHPEHSLCTDAACCQAYLQDISQVGENVRQAVLGTLGEVLMYDDQLIEAVYSACSGGTTESAVNVWQTDYPYLQTVVSPGEERADCFLEELLFTKDELEEKLCVELPDESSCWFQEISYSNGGGIETVKIGNVIFRGTELRSLLQLHSTAITIFPEDHAIRLQTRGYGHRVGMSQFGANAMAESGSNYQEILQHYYPGTNLERMHER